jgi:molecular chaperone GrpE
MERFDERQFLQPRYGRRLRNDEIRVTPRSHGYRRQEAPANFPLRANGHGHGADTRRVVVEPVATEPGVRKEKEDLLLKARAEANEWKEKYTRLYAEQENERKRLERLYASQAEQTIEQLLCDMLPLADNLARALEHSEEQQAGLQEGVELTLKAFARALAKYGVEPIEAEGNLFDPTLHEATAAVWHSHLPPGTIVKAEETGYMRQGKLLRPARVLVVGE